MHAARHIRLGGNVRERQLWIGRLFLVASLTYPLGFAPLVGQIQLHVEQLIFNPRLAGGFKAVHTPTRDDVRINPDSVQSPKLQRRPSLAPQRCHCCDCGNMRQSRRKGALRRLHPEARLRRGRRTFSTAEALEPCQRQANGSCVSILLGHSEGLQEMLPRCRNMP
eukprot:scaffold447_cov307-Pinguiococcus_pyrenoidosus.AAC.3